MPSDVSSIKEKMLYSSCKGALVAHVEEEFQLHIDKKVPLSESFILQSPLIPFLRLFSHLTVCYVMLCYCVRWKWKRATSWRRRFWRASCTRRRPTRASACRRPARRCASRGPHRRAAAKCSSLVLCNVPDSPSAITYFTSNAHAYSPVYEYEYFTINKYLNANIQSPLGFGIPFQRSETCSLHSFLLSLLRVQTVLSV